VYTDPVLGLNKAPVPHQYFLAVYSCSVFNFLKHTVLRMRLEHVLSTFPFDAAPPSSVVYIKVFLLFRQYLYSMSVRSVLLESCEEYGIPLPGQPPNQKQEQQIINIFLLK
jgi:hypothetical protein